MSTSKARINVNRVNALKGIRPKSEAVKLPSRRNSLRHGLAGLGAVLLPADEAKPNECRESWRGVLRPGDEVEESPVDRAELHSVKLDRLAIVESAPGLPVCGPTGWASETGQTSERTVMYGGPFTRPHENMCEHAGRQAGASGAGSARRPPGGHAITERGIFRATQRSEEPADRRIQGIWASSRTNPTRSDRTRSENSGNLGKLPNVPNALGSDSIGEFRESGQAPERTQRARNGGSIGGFRETGQTPELTQRARNEGSIGGFRKTGQAPERTQWSGDGLVI